LIPGINPAGKWVDDKEFFLNNIMKNRFQEIF